MKSAPMHLFSSSAVPLGWLIALALLTTPHLGWAQETGTITGTVTEAQTGQPVADVNVVVVGTLSGAATDTDGQFEITGLAPDTYTVQVSAIGFRTARRSVEVEAGETVEVNFRMTVDEERMEEVDVLGRRAEMRPVRSVEARDIRETGAPDVGAALRAAPGVGAVRRGPIGFDPNVRGLTETSVGVFIDGARSFPAGPARMDSPLSHVDPNVVESIEVIKGPYALTEGNTMSTIRVETAPLDPDATAGGRLDSRFQLNGEVAETTGALNGSLAGAPYRIHGTYRTGNDYQSGSDVSVPGSFQSGFVRGQLQVPVTETSRLTATGGYQDQRDVDFPGRLLDATFFESGEVSLRYEQTSDGGLYRGLDAQLYATQTLHGMNNDGKPTADPQFADPPLDVAVDSEIQIFGGRLTTDLAPTPRIAVEVGADGYVTSRDAERTRGPREGDMRVTDEIWPGVTMSETGLFGSATRAFGPVDVSATARVDLATASVDDARVSDAFLENADLENAGGLALDDLSRTEFMPSGSLQLMVPLSDTWTLGVGGGTVARTPSALERYSDRFPSTQAQTSAEFQGNPLLDPERSIQGDLWLEAVSDDWTIEVSGFARQMDNHITVEATDIDPLLPLSPETVYRYVNGTATFFGTEIEGTYALNPLLSVRGQGSFLWGRDDELDEPAFGVIPASLDVGFRGEAPFDDTLFLEATARLTADQTRVAETRGETSTDGYFRADLRLGFSPGGPASLILSLDNITNTSYVNHLNARNPFAEQGDFQEAFVPEPGRSIGLRLSVDF